MELKYWKENKNMHFGKNIFEPYILEIVLWTCLYAAVLKLQINQSFVLKKFLKRVPDSGWEKVYIR